MPRFLAAFLILLITGCRFDPVESQFIVKGDRLPAWVDRSQIHNKDGIEVAMTLHTSGAAKMVVRTKSPRSRVLTRVTGQSLGQVADSNGEFYIWKYPKYFVVEVNGLRDFYEKRAPEPYVYVVDAPVRVQDEP
jgi:hypothetical protein